MNDATGVVNDELPNCWECPKCNHAGKTGKVSINISVWVRIVVSIFSLSVSSENSRFHFWQCDMTDAKFDDTELHVLNELLLHTVSGYCN